MTKTLSRPAFLSLLLMAAVAQAKSSAKDLPLALGALTADDKPVAAGQTLRWGQTLSTGEAPADVRLPGIAAFRLRPASRLRLARDKNGAVRLILEKGGLLSVVRKGSRYSVRTPQAVAAVRGTVFYMQMEPGDKLYTCLCRGRYTLTSADKVRDIQSKGHKGLEVAKGEKDAEAGLLYHTDEEIAELQDALKGK